MPIAARLDHFAIAADNTEKLTKWYEEHLGLVVHVVSGPNPPQTQKVYLVGPPVPRGAAGGKSQSDGIHFGMMIEIMPKNDTPRHHRNSHEPGLSHSAWFVEDFDSALAH